MGLRNDAPELWRGIVGWCREIGIDWPEDDIAAVIGKVRAPRPDDLPEAIGRVLEWCRAAERQNNAEAIAHADLWRMDLPIEITVGPGGEITHRLNPEIDVEIAPEGNANG